MFDKKMVGVVVPISNNKVLMLKRSPKSTQPNRWNFPGGSIEDGESVPEGASRELYEETALDIEIKDMEYIGYLERFPNMHIYFYIGVFDNPEVEINDESSGFMWATLDEVQNLETIGGVGIDKKIYDAILKAMDSRRE